MRWTKLGVSLERRVVVVVMVAAGLGWKVEAIKTVDIMVSAILALGCGEGFGSWHLFTVLRFWRSFWSGDILLRSSDPHLLLGY